MFIALSNHIPPAHALHPENEGYSRKLPSPSPDAADSAVGETAKASNSGDAQYKKSQSGRNRQRLQRALIAEKIAAKNPLLDDLTSVVREEKLVGYSSIKDLNNSLRKNGIDDMGLFLNELEKRGAKTFKASGFAASKCIYAFHPILLQRYIDFNRTEVERILAPFGWPAEAESIARNVAEKDMELELYDLEEKVCLLFVTHGENKSVLERYGFSFEERDDSEADDILSAVREFIGSMMITKELQKINNQLNFDPQKQQDFLKLRELLEAATVPNAPTTDPMAVAEFATRLEALDLTEDEKKTLSQWKNSMDINFLIAKIFNDPILDNSERIDILALKANHTDFQEFSA